MTESRGSASGDANYTTTFQYNTRGQLTRLTHPDGSYIQYGYNPNGTLAWSADERHPGASTDANQRTSYGYDDYKRLLSVTTPLRAAGDPTLRVTNYNYDPSGSGNQLYLRRQRQRSYRQGSERPDHGRGDDLHLQRDEQGDEHNRSYFIGS